MLTLECTHVWEWCRQCSGGRTPWNSMWEYYIAWEKRSRNTWPWLTVPRIKVWRHLSETRYHCTRGLWLYDLFAFQDSIWTAKGKVGWSLRIQTTSYTTNCRCPCNLLFLWEWFEVCRTFLIGFTTGWTQSILICSDPMPTEPTDLIATCAGVEIDVIHFQWLHAKRAL